MQFIRLDCIAWESDLFNELISSDKPDQVSNAMQYQ